MKFGKTKIKVDDKKCSGCSACVVRCPVGKPNYLHIASGGGIFEVRNGTCTVVNIDACRRNDRYYPKDCTMCVDACPFDAIEYED